MTDQSLEASNIAQEPSNPVEEVKVTEEGEIDTAPEVKEEAKPAPEPTEAEKVKMAMQKRIDRQTAASKALQEKVRQLEAQLTETSAKAPKADDAPKQDDFKTYEEWENATIEYKAKLKAEEVLNAKKQEELKALQQQQHMERAKQFEERENAFRTTQPDYDRVAAEAAAEIGTLAQMGKNIGPLRDMVMQMDNPPAMIYQLGKDTDLIATLVDMEPIKAMRELVKLEAALEGTAKAEPQKVPEPIKPVGGSTGAKSLDKMSAKDVLAWAKG